MRKRADTILSLKPWSLSAFLAACLAIVLATTLQEVFASLGTTLHFAAFFPAILIASLLGGVPAGIFAAVATVPIVWWAFMPPIFEFNPLTPADYDRFASFVLCSSLMICFSHLYREAQAIRMKFAADGGEKHRPAPAGRLPDRHPVTPQKLVVLFLSLTGGAIGLFAPVGAVKWLMRIEPEDAGILTLFFFPVWCGLVVAGLLIGRRLGWLMTGGKRALQR